MSRDDEALGDRETRLQTRLTDYNLIPNDYQGDFELESDNSHEKKRGI